jgi:transposase
MIRHSGPLYNWRSRKDVFDAIDDYIGTHGKAVKYAAFRFKVGVTTIYEWIKEGSVVHKKNSTRDGTNNRRISKYHLDWILYYLRNIDCQLYYPEMSDLLWVEFAEIYDKNLIRHALYMAGWTNKIVTGIAAEQNTVTRTLWRRWVEKGINTII